MMMSAKMEWNQDIIDLDDDFLRGAETSLFVDEKQREVSV